MVVAVAVALAAWSLWIRADTGRPRAVIVDQLGDRYPNPAFVRAVTELLSAAGYEVRYVPAGEVTVDMYRDLPAQEPALILLRSHSARRAESETDLADDVTLFTAQRFRRELYADAVLGRRVGAVFNEQENAQDQASGATEEPGETYEGQKLYFGVRGAFIEQDMRGRFNRAPTVILMGCDGLRSERMARAFVAKGAKDFVSWDQPVDIGRTDKATEVLLRHLVLDRLPVAEAVARAMAVVGADPTFGSQLAYYPR